MVDYCYHHQKGFELEMEFESKGGIEFGKGFDVNIMLKGVLLYIRIFLDHSCVKKLFVVQLVAFLIPVQGFI